MCAQDTHGSGPQSMLPIEGFGVADNQTNSPCYGASY